MIDGLQFGRQLIEEQGEAPQAFRENFIRYKALKKYLKYRQLNRVSQNENHLQFNDEQSEKDFLKTLYQQLKDVDRYFHCFKCQHDLKSRIGILETILF